MFEDDKHVPAGKDVGLHFLAALSELFPGAQIIAAPLIRDQLSFESSPARDSFFQASLIRFVVSFGGSGWYDAFWEGRTPPRPLLLSFPDPLGRKRRCEKRPFYDASWEGQSWLEVNVGGC